MIEKHKQQMQKREIVTYIHNAIKTVDDPQITGNKLSRQNRARYPKYKDYNAINTYN